MLVGRFQILLEEKMHVVGNFSKLSQTYGSFEKHRELPFFQKEHFERKHSMARANLNKSKKVLTSTITASKYIPKRPRICIN